jgi:diguanylate cyclase (GGDEF)-like protein
VENALKDREADQRANRDPLTGLPNAGLLAQSLKSELTRARRSSQPLAVVSCELAGLRGVYREHGQAAGDRLLERVANALKQDCRDYDHLGRVGREQFAFVLPGMKPDLLAAKLGRLGVIASDLELSGAGSPSLPVSFRIGQAFYPDDGDSHGVLLEVARHRAAESSSAGPLASLRAALQHETEAPQASNIQPRAVAPHGAIQS